jgi:hypothetical protein
MEQAYSWNGREKGIKIIAISLCRFLWWLYGSAMIFEKLALSN